MHHPRLIPAALALAIGVVIAAIPASTALAAGPAAGACSAKNLRVNVARTTFQEALAESQLGDTIRVSGTCTPGQMLTIPFSLTIQGRKTAAGPAEIAGAGDHRLFYLSGGPASKVVFKAITLRGGRATGTDIDSLGGALYSSATLTLTDVILADNQAIYGGAIWAESGGSITLDGSTIVRNNVATEDGGAIDLRPDAGGTKLTVEGRTVMHHNRAKHGGAIHAEGSTVLVRGAAILRDNVAGEAADLPYGGGGAINLVGARLTVTGDAVLRGNRAAGGGAIQGGNSHDPLVLSRIVISGSARISGNRVGAFGAAINAEGSVVVSQLAVISGNVNDGPQGGAIDVFGYNAEPVAITIKDNARVRDNTSATGGAGLVAWMTCGSVPVIKGTRGRVIHNEPKNLVKSTTGYGC